MTDLESLAKRAGDELDGAPALDILTWAVEQFGSSWCVASSMADSVLPHLASRALPGVDIVFLDTGYHFAETIGTRDAVAATLPVNVRTITPAQTVAEQDAQYGARLYERNPDLCCAHSSRHSRRTPHGRPGCGATRHRAARASASWNGMPSAARSS